MVFMGYSPPPEHPPHSCNGVEGTGAPQGLHPEGGRYRGSEGCLPFTGAEGLLFD